MNERTFDLIALEVGLIVAGPLLALRLWSNYRLKEGKAGLLFELAKMGKAVTG